MSFQINFIQTVQAGRPAGDKECIRQPDIEHVQGFVESAKENRVRICAQVLGQEVLDALVVIVRRRLMPSTMSYSMGGVSPFGYRNSVEQAGKRVK